MSGAPEKHLVLLLSQLLESRRARDQSPNTGNFCIDWRAGTVARVCGTVPADALLRCYFSQPNDGEPGEDGCRPAAAAARTLRNGGAGLRAHGFTQGDGRVTALDAAPTAESMQRVFEVRTQCDGVQFTDLRWHSLYRRNWRIVDQRRPIAEGILDATLNRDRDNIRQPAGKRPDSIEHSLSRMVLIRPDGYIAATATPEQALPLLQHLRLATA